MTKYVLAAFKVTEAKSIMYRKYKTLKGLRDGVFDAMMKHADYVSIRRVREENDMV